MRATSRPRCRTPHPRPRIDGDEGPPIAVGTLLLERKLARGLGLCGHVGAHRTDANGAWPALRTDATRPFLELGRPAPSCAELTRFPEDFVVEESMRGTGVGRMLLEALVELGREMGCYKVILDSPLDAVGFFEKSCMFQNDVASAEVWLLITPSCHADSLALSGAVFRSTAASAVPSGAVRSGRDAALMAHDHLSLGAHDN